MQFIRSSYEQVRTSSSIIFKSLSYTNYRFYFFGQSISLIGIWVQNIALSWLVYRLTGSAFLLGTVVFALHIPSLFITPIAGVMADRWSRRKTIMTTQSLSMIVAFALAFLTLTDNITVGWIIALAATNGVVLAFDTPFRQAFVPDMITRDGDMGNAIALNSTLYNLARFIGPPIGGVLIGLVGEGWCFFINGVSFLAVMAALIRIKVSKQAIVHAQASVLMQFKEGLIHAWDVKPLRYLLRLLLFSGFFGLPFQALLPLFAAEVLQGDATLLGMLTGALGSGALVGALYLAAQQRMQKIPALTHKAALAFSLGLAVFAISPCVWLSMIALSATGFGMIIHFNATNTLLQSMADEDKRGRIVALYSLTFMGITPVGSLAAGLIAEHLGVPYTVFAFSVICLVSAVWFGNKLNPIIALLAQKKPD